MSDGEVSKSILYTDVYARLREQYRIVFLVHPKKIKYFRTALDGEVYVEEMPHAQSKFLQEIFLDLMLFSVPTRSITVKIEHAYYAGGSWFGRFLKYTLWQLGHVRLFRQQCRFLYQNVPDSSFEKLFQQYKPSLVFAANLTSTDDARLIKVARKHGIFTVGMPKGWDNLTLKTLLPIFPDRLLVQTPLLQRDAEALDYPPEQIVLTGFPKFDTYADKSDIPTREEFMRSLGLDPSTKLIVYAGAGDMLAPQDEEVLANFLDAIDRGEVLGRPSVIVRPHPKYVYRDDVLPKKDFWVLDRPGAVVGERLMDFEFRREDILHLKASLWHADLVIHTASTLGVEASILNKPSITIGYEPRTVPGALSTARYYHYEHYERVIKTGGMKVARSNQELVRYTNEYLGDASLDSVGRQIIVEENAYRIDGQAGERVAKELIRMIER